MAEQLQTADAFALAPAWCGLSSMENAMALAQNLASSSLVPAHFKDKPNDILVAMFWCESLKIPITQGLQSIAVVNGRPSLWGDGALAVVRASGKLEDMAETFDGDERNNTLRAICRVKRVGEASEAVAVFSMDDARKAGLLGRSTYKAYLRRMLQMRARGFALRDKFPDVLMGMAVAEEMEDFGYSQQLDELVTKPAEEAEASKMPRVKKGRKKAKAEEATTDKTADVVDVEEVVEAEAVESLPEPVEEEPAQQEGEELETADTVADKVANCRTVKDLMDLWRGLGITKEHPDAHLFTERKAELAQ